jgi:hypothetical protein
MSKAQFPMTKAWVRDICAGPYGAGGSQLKSILHCSGVILILGKRILND